MRALAAVVNDIARAMRRQGKQMQKDAGHPMMFEAGASRLLLSYADLLTAATRRQHTKTKRKTAGLRDVQALRTRGSVRL